MSKPTPVARASMTDAEIEQWIEACNHEPAKDVLRGYLNFRAGIKRLSEEEEICGETMSEEDAFDLVRMAAKLAEYEKANVAYVDANTALISRATAAEARLEEALKVIEPFAKEAAAWEECFDDEGIVEPFPQYQGENIRVGHLRAARRFMEESR